MSDISRAVPRILITGTGSGCGKTTIVCAILRALKDRGKRLCAFKCGPDYIDPMFHSRVTGIRSRNLDLFMCGEEGVKTLFLRNTAECDIAVIEGAMGMYDGIGFSHDRFSANDTSLVLGSPTILAVNTRGKGTSVLAEIEGYLRFRRNNVKGVILNNCSKAMYQAYKKAIEEGLSVKVFGFMPSMAEAELESRHLGLITADEVKGLEDKLKALGRQAEESIDLEGIIETGERAQPIWGSLPHIEPVMERGFKLAVAWDKGFCFYYEDNLDLLRELGGKILFFSPLNDEDVPEDADGLILGGGYPEEYLDILSEAKNTAAGVRRAAERQAPIWAECGGFMYLGKSIEKDGREYEMAGVLPGRSYMTDKPVRFGYKTLTARRDTLMCRSGQSIRCHEFHYSDCTENGDAFQGVKNSGQRSLCVISDGNIFAGYPHIHLWSNVEFAVSFAKACASYGGRKWK